MFRPDLLLAGKPHVGTLFPDSFHFLEFSLRLLGQDVRFGESAGAWATGLEFRTPGYPLLLAPMLQFLGWQQWVSAVLVTHFVLWVLVGFAAGRLFRDVAAPPLTRLALAIASVLMLPYATALISEWVLFLALILIVGLYYRCIKDRTYHHLFFVSLAVVFAILIRPDYVFLLVVLPLAGSSLRGRLNEAIAVLTLACIPLLIWLGFNFSRFGRLTLAPMEGFSTCLTSTLGPVESEPGDSPEFAALVSLMREKAGVASVYDFSTILLGGGSFDRLSSSNLALFTDFQKERGLAWEPMNSMMSRYSLRAIATYPFRYLVLVSMGSLSLIWALPIIALLIELIRRIGRHDPLAHVALLAAFIHVAHTIAVAASVIIRLRYFLPSFALLIFMCFILAIKLHGKHPHE